MLIVASCADLSNLSGRDPDAATQDAATQDASVVDASVDDAPSDAGAVERDAAGDGAPTDGDAGSFCANRGAADAALCFDFDDGRPPSAAWSGPVSNQGNIFTIDTTASTSPPASLLAMLPATDASSTYAFLWAQAPTNVNTRARLAFDIRVDATDPAQWMHVARLELGPRGASYGVGVRLKQDALVVQEDIPQDGAAYMFVASSALPALKPSIWAHLDLDVDFAGSQLSLRVDGALVYGPKAPEPGNLRGPCELRVGDIFASGPIANVAVRLDNVVLDLQ